jgi:hypothetical protein
MQEVEVDACRHALAARGEGLDQHALLTIPALLEIERRHAVDLCDLDVGGLRPGARSDARRPARIREREESVTPFRIQLGRAREAIAFGLEVRHRSREGFDQAHGRARVACLHAAAKLHAAVQAVRALERERDELGARARDVHHRHG